MTYSYGSTAQFGKSIRPKILPHTKVIKGREYCMYFPLREYCMYFPLL